MEDICMKDETDTAVQFYNSCLVCGAPGDKFAYCRAAHATCESCLAEEIVKVLTDHKPRLACQVKGCTESINTGFKKDEAAALETLVLKIKEEEADTLAQLCPSCQVCGAPCDKFAFCQAAHATCKSCLTEEITKVLTEHKPRLLCQVKGCKENIKLEHLTVKDPTSPLAVSLLTSAHTPQDAPAPISCPECYGQVEFQEKTQLYKCPDPLCRMVSFKWWRISIPTGQTEEETAELVKRYSRDQRTSCPEERRLGPACLEDLRIFPKRWKKGRELKDKVKALDVKMETDTPQDQSNHGGFTQGTVPSEICQVCQEPTGSQTCQCSKHHIICRLCLKAAIKRRIQADKMDGENRKPSEICDVCCKMTSGSEFVVCKSSHVICESCMMKHISEFLANSSSPPAWSLGCPVEGCLHALKDADLDYLSSSNVTRTLSTHWKLLPELPGRQDNCYSESSESDECEEPPQPLCDTLVKRPSAREPSYAMYTNMFRSVLGTDNQEDDTSRDRTALVHNKPPVKSRGMARSDGGRYFHVEPSGLSNTTSSPSFSGRGGTPDFGEQSDFRTRHYPTTTRCHVCGDHHAKVCSCPGNHILCLACVEKAVEGIPAGSEVPLACIVETCQEHISRGELENLTSSSSVIKYLSGQRESKSTSKRRSYSRFEQSSGPSTSSDRNSGAPDGSRRLILIRNPAPAYLPLKTPLHRHETEGVPNFPAQTQNSLACPVGQCGGTISLDEMKPTPWIRDFKHHIRRSQVLAARQMDQEEQVTARCAVCGTTAAIDQGVATFHCPSTSCRSVTCRFCKSNCSALNDPSHAGCCLLKLSGDESSETLSKIPAHWYQYHDSVYQHGSGCMLVPVALGSPEGSSAVKFYGLTSKSVVKGVWRVQNPYLWHKYNSHKVRLVRNLGSKCQEKLLFHGASSSFQDRICQQGFDFPAGTSLRYFGRDTSFYTQAHLAEHLSQDCHQVLLTFVLCGKSGPGKVSYTCAWRDYVGNQLDTLVDNLSRPDMFVAYSSSQCYPAYVVQFE